MNPKQTNYDEFKDLSHEFKQHQDRLSYYLMSLCVGGIGYSIYSTTGEGLHTVQIPLGLAVLSWGLSVNFGLRFLTYVGEVLYLNARYLETIHDDFRTDEIEPNRHKDESLTLENQMNSFAKRGTRNLRLQHGFFYLGMVCFLIYHVSNMYHRTPKTLTDSCSII